LAFDGTAKMFSNFFRPSSQLLQVIMRCAARSTRYLSQGWLCPHASDSRADRVKHGPVHPASFIALIALLQPLVIVGVTLPPASHSGLQGWDGF
jgi:hypothetical protein